MSFRKQLLLIPLVGIVSFVLYTSCGGSSSTTTSGNSAGPSAGIASPATVGSSRSVAAHSGAPRWDLYGSSTGCGDGKSLDAQLTEVKDAADPDKLAATALSLANLADPNSVRAECYGPSWRDNSRGSNVDRPSGDLGIMYATATDTDTTACVACQLNALVSSGPGLGNRVIKFFAMGIAALKKDGKELPAAGSSVDLAALSTLPAVTGVTITTFTVERLTDRDGHALYKYVLKFTNTAGKAADITSYHEQLASDNSQFSGIIYGTLPHTPTSGSGDTRGFSFVYHQTSSAYKFTFRTAANRATSSSDFFNATTKVVDFTKAAFGEDGHYILGYFDTVNNNSVLHYAWQAGEQDNSVRAFSINIAAGTKGSRTGTGWFGFGKDLASIVATDAPWMSGMYCDWLAAIPITSHPTVNFTSNKVQRQTITEGTTAFTVASSNINFAPSGSTCNAASWTTTDPTVPAGATTPTFLKGTRATPANDLVAAPTAADFSYNFATAGNEPTFTIP